MHKVIHSASDLPPAWDRLAKDNLFMTTAYLDHLEKAQKRETEYHLFYDTDNKLDSLFVLFVYPDFPFYRNTILPFKKRIRMIYYPVPLSKSTIIIGSKTKNEVETVIKKIKGFTLICNMPEEDLLDLPYAISFARCNIHIKWHSFEAYLDSLRSHYRYKYRKILKQCDDLNLKDIDSRKFNKEMYQLYENVYEKTDLKINKAEITFFQSKYSHIITINIQSKCIGFVQLIGNGKELVFSLIGLDYSYTKKYNLYVRLMLELIKYGIENGFTSIDLGQTTYDAKRKLGSEIKKLYIQANHGNKLILRLLLFFKDQLLDEQDYSQIYNVFKNDKRGS